MTHWSAQFVGMPCGDHAKDFDCADLAILVQERIFGHVIIQPDLRKIYQGYEGHVKFKKMSEEIAIHKHQYVRQTQMPEEGDPVLLTIRGYMQHVGVFCKPTNEPWILHAADGTGQVVMQRIRELGVRG